MHGIGTGPVARYDGTVCWTVGSRLEPQVASWQPLLMLSETINSQLGRHKGGPYYDPSRATSTMMQPHIRFCKPYTVAQCQQMHLIRGFRTSQQERCLLALRSVRNLGEVCSLHWLIKPCHAEEQQTCKAELLSA